jgi:hypothetical protein
VSSPFYFLRQYCRASAGSVDVVVTTAADLFCLLSASVICVVDVVTTIVVSIVGPLQAGVVAFLLSSSVL